VKQTIQHGHKTTAVPFLVHPAKKLSRYCRTSYDSNVTIMLRRHKLCLQSPIAAYAENGWVVEPANAASGCVGRMTRRVPAQIERGSDLSRPADGLAGKITAKHILCAIVAFLLLICY
jgi:hypothetical protein